MAIDAAMGGSKRGVTRVRRLLTQNPDSTWSTHVQYNIGKARGAWLHDFADEETRALAEAFARVRAG